MSSIFDKTESEKTRAELEEELPTLEYRLREANDELEGFVDDYRYDEGDIYSNSAFILELRFRFRELERVAADLALLKERLEK